MGRRQRGEGVQGGKRVWLLYSLILLWWWFHIKTYQIVHFDSTPLQFQLYFSKAVKKNKKKAIKALALSWCCQVWNAGHSLSQYPQCSGKWGGKSLILCLPLEGICAGVCFPLSCLVLLAIRFALVSPLKPSFFFFPPLIKTDIFKIYSGSLF